MSVSLQKSLGDGQILRKELHNNVFRKCSENLNESPGGDMENDVKLSFTDNSFLGND